MRRRLGAIGLVLLAGCALPSSRSRTTSYADFGYTLTPSSFGLVRVEQPRSGLSPAAVTSELEAVAAREAEQASAAEGWASARAELSLEEAARAVDAAYARADVAAADALVARHPQLVTWEDALEDGRLRAEATFAREGGDGCLYVALSLPAIAADAPGLGVVFPPGTYAVAAEGERWVDPDQERRYGEWPSVQDLACLDAGAVILSPERPVVTVRLPVACASFERLAPEPGLTFRLERFPRESAIERLLVQLCATDGARADPAEAQVAVWLARNRIRWSSFVEQGGTIGRLSTFRGNRAITHRDAQGAALLLLESGVDPHGLSFFRDGEAQGPEDVRAAELLAPAPPPAEAEEPAPQAPAPAEEPELPELEALTAA
ncbi:MAG: hypothetical protein R3F62_31605 [Planctomycetota bacterium]